MGYIEKGRAKTLTKIILWLVVISFIATIFVTWGRAALRPGRRALPPALRVGGVDITPEDMEYYGNFYRYVQDRLHFRFYRSLYLAMSQQGYLSATSTSTAASSPGTWPPTRWVTTSPARPCSMRAPAATSSR